MSVNSNFIADLQLGEAAVMQKCKWQQKVVPVDPTVLCVCRTYSCTAGRCKSKALEKANHTGTSFWSKLTFPLSSWEKKPFCLSRKHVSCQIPIPVPLEILCCSLEAVSSQELCKATLIFSTATRTRHTDYSDFQLTNCEHQEKERPQRVATSKDQTWMLALCHHKALMRHDQDHA